MSYVYSPKDNIKEVYSENMIDELRKISDLIEEFNYISMDTEFPGVIYPNTHQMTENVFCNFSNTSLFNGISPGHLNPNLTKFSSETPKKLMENNSYYPTTSSQNGCYDFSYKNIKLNVDELKIIQLGITLSDQYGNHPEDISTWQFNFKFDLQSEKYLHESIQLLEFAGIDFNKFFHEGIDQEYFAENIIASGLILNENVKWVTFQGAYDFAYLLKTISNQLLPEDEQTFLEYLFIHFPNFYDLRYMIKNITWLKGSLSRIATDLEVKWNGAIHQAGCDSKLTSKVFTKLCLSHGEYIDLQKDLNMLFGINSYVEDDQEKESLSQNKYDLVQGNTINYSSSNCTNSYNKINKFQINTSLRPNNGIVYNPYVNMNFNNQNPNVLYSVINSSNNPINNFNNFYGVNVNTYVANAIRK